MRQPNDIIQHEDQIVSRLDHAIVEIGQKIQGDDFIDRVHAELEHGQDLIYTITVSQSNDETYAVRLSFHRKTARKNIFSLHGLAL